MNITATNLRRELFQVMERAKEGEEVVITHKGAQFRLVPEQPVSKLDRITPIEDFHTDVTAEDWERIKLEMQTEWEAKWDKRLQL